MGQSAPLPCGSRHLCSISDLDHRRDDDVVTTCSSLCSYLGSSAVKSRPQQLSQMQQLMRNNSDSE